MEEVDSTVPEVIDGYFGEIGERFNVEEIIKEKVNNLPSEKLETLLMNLLEKEFKFIEYIGAVIGFIIGWVQVGMVLIGA